MKQLESLSSRQQRRKFLRSASKKIGQVKSIQSEFEKPLPVRKAKANFKNLLRLQDELTSMGVMKHPTKWQRFKGRCVATFKQLFRGF
jgi:hypothetical protein